MEDTEVEEKLFRAAAAATEPSWTCANCSMKLTKHNVATTAQYFLPTEKQNKTAQQAIKLIFEGEDVTESGESNVNLCSSCGEILGQVLNSYMNFIRVTSLGSYVYNLRNRLKERRTLNEREIPQRQDQVPSSSTRQGISIRNVAELRDEDYHDEVILNKNPTKKTPPRRPVAAIILRSGKVPTVRMQPTSTVYNKKNTLRSVTVTRRPASSARPTGFLQNTLTKKSSEANQVFSEGDVSNNQTPVNTTQFKCDDATCVTYGVSFSTLLGWAVHQEQNHGLKTGYHPDDLAGTEELIPRHYHWRPCPECGTTFTGSKLLRIHLSTSHLKLPCKYCEKTFENKDLAKEHMKAVHNNGKSLQPQPKPQPQSPPVPCICELCGVVLRDKPGLGKHRKSYCAALRGQNLMCDICGATFRNRFVLNEHLVYEHSDDMPFACSECKQRFKTERDLGIHSKRHTKNLSSDIMCEFCRKTFAFKCSLKDHLMSAHKMTLDEANSTANIKTRRKRTKKPIAQPVKRTTVSPTCDICGKTLYGRRELVKHYKSVHRKSDDEAKAMINYKK